MQKKKTKRYGQVTYLVAGIIILGVAGSVSYLLLHHSTAMPAQITTTKRNQINYSPPTVNEQKSGDQQKQIDVQRQQSQSIPDKAAVTISNVGQSGDIVRVRAFVSNVVESGGTCITTLTKGAATVTTQTAAFADASTTQCGVIDFNRSQFGSSGTWQVMVTYQSSAIKGTATSTIDIQ
jgi:hypothetical protein